MSNPQTPALDWSRSEPDPELREMVKAAIGAEKERAREREEAARIAAHPMLALLAAAKDEGWHDLAKQAEAWLQTLERDVTSSRASLLGTRDELQTARADRRRYRGALRAIANRGHEERCEAWLESHPGDRCICPTGIAEDVLRPVGSPTCGNIRAGRTCERPPGHVGSHRDGKSYWSTEALKP